MSRTETDSPIGATHFLLAHLSVKPNQWVLRREFPVAPGLSPSTVVLHYNELDIASRTAIHEHLNNVNGSENDLGSVNWSLNSIWRLHDVDDWFSFAIILECLPISRAISRRSIIVPHPKPRVLYHLSMARENRTEYTLEHRMPVSEAFDPSAANSGSQALTYDVCDPSARNAIAQVIERANQNETDLLRKPWGLISISRVNPRPKATGANAKVGLAIVLQWQPGESNTLLTTGLPATISPLSSTLNGELLAPTPMGRLSTTLTTQSSSNSPTSNIQLEMPHVSPPEYTA